jgi:hypothetical protein
MSTYPSRYALVAFGSAKSEGRWYVEVEVGGDAASYFQIGIGSTAWGDSVLKGGHSEPNEHYIVYTHTGALCCKHRSQLPPRLQTFDADDTYPPYGSTFASGDVIGIAFDADRDTLEFYVNGVGQGLTSTSTDVVPTGAWDVYANDNSSGDQAASFMILQQSRYAVPDGFRYWTPN